MKDREARIWDNKKRAVEKELRGENEKYTSIFMNTPATALDSH